jgi:hypothetical protein
MSPKDLAKKVVPLITQFFNDHVTALENRPQQQPMIVGGHLRPPNQNPNYYPPESSKTAYEHQGQRPGYQNQSPQGHDQEIADCLRAHNEGTLSLFPTTMSSH